MKLKSMLVKEFLDSYRNISIDTTIKNVIEIFRDKSIQMIPVVSNNKFIGIIEEIDLIKVIKREAPSSIHHHLWYEEIDIDEIEKKNVWGIVNRNCIYVMENDNLEHVIKIMSTSKKSMLPVINTEGNFVGVIRISSIIKKVCEGT